MSERLDFKSALGVLEKLFKDGVRIIIFDGRRASCLERPKFIKDLSDLIIATK